MNQASLVLKKIKDKKAFFFSNLAVNKCILKKDFINKQKTTLKLCLTQNVQPIVKRCAILNAIQKQIQKDFVQQTKEIVKLIDLKNESKKKELTQRIILSKKFIEIKKLINILTHFLKLPCEFSEYHNLQNDTCNTEYLAQETAITFVKIWMQLNQEFLQKKTPMSNASVLLTLYMDN